jgi:mannose-6-phosphate isomerase-like protein (cupin superfamily)
MSLEIRPFPRPDWSPLPGAVGVEGKVLVRDGSFFIAMLRFHEDATTHEHPGETDTIVICIDGSGFTSVGAEAAPITAGQEVRWPEGALHRLWTEGSTMTTLTVEAGPQPELRGRI